jgi:hypothetical protein
MDTNNGDEWQWKPLQYQLQYACEGFQHPDALGRHPGPYWKRDKIACAPEFSYPWLPELWYRPKRDNPARQKVEGWSNPTDSATRPMFRLPVVDITKVHVVRARLIVRCCSRMATHFAPIQNILSVYTYK